MFRSAAPRAARGRSGERRTAIGTLPVNAHTQRLRWPGPAGEIEVAIDEPVAAPTGWLLACHPHPQQGGTLDNKVVQTLARAALQVGWRSVRFNFRGVGGSAGSWGGGDGEIDDALAVAEAAGALPGAGMLPLALAGFSFGGFVAASVAGRLLPTRRAARLALVAPSTQKQTVPALPAGLGANTVVVHGEADDVVPWTATLDWARPQGLPVTIVPGVGHFFHGQLPLLKALIVRAWSTAAEPLPAVGS